MLAGLFRLLGWGRSGPPRVPDGTRVYAIGDIHGRDDLLRELHGAIAGDAASAPEREKTVVYLGDYVDRGLESRRVIDLLLDEPIPGVAPRYLKGNHEDLMLRFLDDASVGPDWLELGGAATLYSYGVALPGLLSDERTLVEAQRRLSEAVPARHLAFLRGLDLHHVAGDYLFVHAGIRPGVPLAAQAEEDLLWIREEFLVSTEDHGHVVVHGHSINVETVYRPNRISIDTGAYATGILTCLVLDGDARRVLRTGG